MNAGFAPKREDSPKDFIKRSGTPVTANLAFTPTSVIRKMKADGSSTPSSSHVGAMSMPSGPAYVNSSPSTAAPVPSSPGYGIGSPMMTGFPSGPGLPHQSIFNSGVPNQSGNVTTAPMQGNSWVSS